MSADPNADLIAAAQRIDQDEWGVNPERLLFLQRNTPADAIQTRPGPHSKFCEKPCNVRHDPLRYVDARYVMDTLDEGVGPQNWQREDRMVEVGGKVIVSSGIGIFVKAIGWVWKWDGAGETDIEGEKGAFSDSFKRAGVSWGIARDLYDKDDGRVGASSAPTADAVRTASPRPPAAATREPDYWDREADQGGGGTCPNHGKPWTLGQYGWYCKSKASGDQPANARGYCTLKPSLAWAARQEVA